MAACSPRQFQIISCLLVYHYPPAITHVQDDINRGFVSIYAQQQAYNAEAWLRTFLHEVWHAVMMDLCKADFSGKNISLVNKFGGIVFVLSILNGPSVQQIL